MSNLQLVETFLASVTSVPPTNNNGAEGVNVDTAAENPSSSWKEDAQKLLDLLAENEIAVPEQLKRNILARINGEDVPKEVQDREASSEGRLSNVSHSALFNSVTSSIKSINEEEDDLVRHIRNSVRRVNRIRPEFQVRVKNGSFTVVKYVNPTLSGRRKMSNVNNVVSASLCYKLYQALTGCVVTSASGQGKMRVEKHIMRKVNLCLETGKMYLVLGAPGSGKSTLLKMIADTLHKDKHTEVGGQVSIAGITPSKTTNWTKLVSYIDQIDRLHSFLTVQETFSFAWKCRSGGTHRLELDGHDAETNAIIAEMDEKQYLVNAVMDGLGLTRVKDTFVGDQMRVRGVSSGEKKRVTVGEMFCCPTVVRCCDEISTGLDAATTFDITRLIGQTNRMTEKICLISLLQPPPETVALFDEIILISDGLIIYSGPLDQVENHFNCLGYSIPERMDLADWLQSVPTQDGAQWLRHSGDDEGETPKHLTPEEFQERFEESKLGQEILEKLNAPNNSKHDENLVSMTMKKYANPWYKSLDLLVRREALLWWRDKYAIKAKIVQTILMGTIVGTVFFQQKDPRTILSALFQSMFYTIIGAMILVRNQFFDRPVFYKQQDAKFFPSWSYVLGCSIASIPNALFDALGYGTFIFWLVGLSYTEGASAANYFIFLLLLFVTSLSAGLVFGIFSTAVQNITTSQACMAILSLLCVLFSGFTVQPDVIPNYYIWLYWLNPFAWLLRGLVVNQFESGQFDEASSEPGLTDGELVLVRFGFTLDDEPYTFEWVWWGILFAVACALLAMLVSTFMLNLVRFATGLALDDDSGNIEETLQEDGEMKALNLPFSRGVLTFKNMHYSVTSSITKETMELLKGIDGVLEAGKMTALMGSSGAGKSTLMDVLALRKTSGTIEGDVRLNGHPIDPSSFRRCTGYVEQFDVQSAQLTIKETLKFSARLRLDERTVSKEDRDKFVAETLAILELTDIQHLQVGSDDSGGLSFEQRKRLSIANELVANPTIIFADEPTSGLDSRSAAVIMRGLKRIASSGRTVCATIHQPSIAIFNEFDSLLLLKRGGEVVYHGAIGKDACCLIEYFERYEGTPKILPGENPATWMLKVTGAGSATGTKKLYDYAGSYSVSKLRERCLARIDEISAGASEEERIVYERKYATSAITQYLTVFKKGWVVYFRSPSYNTVRMTVSGVIALLFASVYASQRIPTNESDLISRINSIFISVLFMCVNAQNTVLGIFENERNMFYRHKSANMYGSTPILVAYTLAELPFILLTGAVFSVLFYFIMGFEQAAGPFFSFFMFVTLGIATFTFQGQMLVSLLKDSKTAQSLGGLLVSCTSLFSGVLIPPQAIPTFWIFMYWILPGHWIMEGLFTSQYGSSQIPIEASLDSPFYVALGCNETDNSACMGTAGEWLAVTFTSFSADNIKWDVTYLVVMIVISRAVSWVALTNLNYRST